MTDASTSDAALVARVLRGSWRSAPPPCDLTPAEIEQVAPLLIMSGAAGLGWRRIEGMPLARSAAALQEAARMQALDDSVKEAALSRLCALLNAAGVTPLLFKGWAAGRSYPQTWLRPFGDFDLLVRPCDFASARAALAAAAIRPAHGNDFALPLGSGGVYGVDLHRGLDAFYAADGDTLFRRARKVTIPGGNLLVPSPEDHLRLCAIHMLRHGAWRPLWLCDVAAMSEAAGEAFDWQVCLGDRPATAAWIAAAVGLAHLLLGAHIDDLPPHLRKHPVPDWLEATVRQHWAYPHPAKFRAAVALDWRDPFGSLKQRWPDPIRATIWSGGLPETGPRLPWQLRHCAATFGRGIWRRFSRF